MNKDHFVQLSGKSFVLYKGLLALSHERGIKSIAEEIIQVPSPENDEMAVVKAVITDADGNTWSGIGDANPGNVNRNIAKHVLRMASTRAKARAMRDMCNIGETALEELGGDDSPAPAPAIDKPDPQDLLQIRSLAAKFVKGGVDGLEKALGHSLSSISATKAKEVLFQLQLRESKKATEA